jgi:hypothetical protein
MRKSILNTRNSQWVFFPQEPIPGSKLIPIKITPSEESFILNELLSEYLRVTANFQGSLFCHFGGKFLTAYQFAQMLISVGIDHP